MSTTTTLTILWLICGLLGSLLHIIKKHVEGRKIMLSTILRSTIVAPFGIIGFTYTLIKMTNLDSTLKQVPKY